MANKPMVPCVEFADRLVDLSDGDLPEDQQTLVADHIAHCAACREELRRLNASLATLHGAIVAPPGIDIRPRARVARAAWLAAGATAAAVFLAIGVMSALKTPTVRPDETAHIAASGQIDSPTAGATPNGATTGRGYAGGKTTAAGKLSTAGKITTDEALRRIALLEQAARLETSLSLMPNDPWFADQRAANERLLTKFRETMAAAPNNSQNRAPVKKETL